ncbi:hypothetical protein [Vibrio tetraodonis]|uniref:hypothetical protein n=1 Tax=Vibrio tetraodonis TaxID=2231647 RepID=UPI000E0C2BC3|nr:hypothetical protein [Vibrio tetraodonis]
MGDEGDSREYNYELVLVGTSNLKFNMIDDKVRLAPSSKDDFDNTASDVMSMPPEIAKYSF